MKSADYRDRIAQAIFNGIEAYLAANYARPLETNAHASGFAADLSAALAEAANARERPYYDAGKDERDVRTYYGGWKPSEAHPSNYDHLAVLVASSHHERPAYKPMLELYPWIDVHEHDGGFAIRSIYSGKRYDVAEFIEMDARVEAQRMALLGAAAFAALSADAEAFLEAQLPYNCEHVVPQSWFRKKEPMRGDLHHLFACESGCHSFRGNVPYLGFPDFKEVVRGDCGKRETNRFEPSAGKGPIARAVLYFLLRYPGEINRTANEYTSDRLETFVAWHKAYPVERYEKHRNQYIFARQGNRNPLIDFPGWIDEIHWERGLG